MRVGVFGGTFDPVHVGHALLAECCQRQAALDRVMFVPAAQQPHKAHSPVASAADRVAMLRLATAEIPTWETATLEIDRGGVSYTVDTLREIHGRDPQAELFFLLGADALADLPTWRESQSLCELALPLAVRRPGAGEPDFAALGRVVSRDRVDQIRAAQVTMPATPVSSSEIQRLIRTAGPWRELVPRDVAEYIVAHGLYGASPRSS